MTAIAVLELTNSAARWETWSALAWADTKSRYRRTTIGPFWLTLSTGAMVGSVGLLYAGLFGSDISQYLPFLGVGMIVWIFINSVITEGCNVFITAAGYIKSVPLPLAAHVYRPLARHAIILAHNPVLLIVLLLMFRWPIGLDAPFAVLGFLIALIAVAGVALTLGILCARFRDIPQIVMAITQLLFLLTPIMWMPSTLKSPALAVVIEWNPIYHLIEVIRGPLLGQTPAVEIWIKAMLLALASLAIGVASYQKFRHRVAYWL